MSWVRSLYQKICLLNFRSWTWQETLVSTWTTRPSSNSSKSLFLFFCCTFNLKYRSDSMTVIFIFSFFVFLFSFLYDFEFFYIINILSNLTWYDIVNFTCFPFCCFSVTFVASVLIHLQPFHRMRHLVGLLCGAMVTQKPQASRTSEFDSVKDEKTCQLQTRPVKLCLPKPFENEHC